MRATFVILCMLWFGMNLAHAQAPLEVGAPASAFAGGPIHLTKNQAAMLLAHYQGDKVPLVPQPFRGKLDLALLGRDWPKVEGEKKGLVAAHGMVAALMWEQSRFIATGSLGVAEMHALDIAATGSSGLSETAVMLWFYAAAVTMTDGHKCVDEAAKEAHLDRLRGPEFEPVLRLVRSIGDDRLAAMRDLAIRLEALLAVDRNHDTMCRSGNGPADVKPDAVWRPEAAETRGMLPRHLLALASIMRPRPAGGTSARPSPLKPEPVATPIPKLAVPETVEPVLPGAGLSMPIVPPAVFPTPVTPSTPTAEAVKPDAATAPVNVKPAPAPQIPAPQINASPAPGSAELVDPNIGQPNPARFEPPNLELTTPAPANPTPAQTNH
jgi:hypothetical protein